MDGMASALARRGGGGGACGASRTPSIDGRRRPWMHGGGSGAGGASARRGMHAAAAVWRREMLLACGPGAPWDARSGPHGVCRRRSVSRPPRTRKLAREASESESESERAARSSEIVAAQQGKQCGRALLERAPALVYASEQSRASDEQSERATEMLDRRMNWCWSAARLRPRAGRAPAETSANAVSGVSCVRGVQRAAYSETVWCGVGVGVGRWAGRSPSSEFGGGGGGGRAAGARVRAPPPASPSSPVATGGGMARHRRAL